MTYIEQLSQAIDGRQFDEALIGLLSALMMLVASLKLDDAAQDKLLAQINEVMHEQMRAARVILAEQAEHAA